MDTQIQEIIKKCTIEGMVVKLPEGQLDRAVYAKVAKALEGIGGKWNRKVSGFVFPHDPSDLLAEVSGGKSINLKKEFQFFGTPPELCNKLVRMADLKENHTVLEPSAGDGAIIKAINRVFPLKMVDCCELMGVNRTALKEIPTANLIGADFLEPDLMIMKYDRIIANPPFTKNLDVIHLGKMYDCLKSGGRIVCVTSTHWKNSSNKIETDFRAWLQNIGATVEDVDAGTFKSSGTMVATVIITINKK